MRKLLLLIILFAEIVSCAKDHPGNIDESEGNGLTQEVVDLYTALEARMDSNEFQEYETLKELEAAIKSWLTEQKEIQRVTSEDGALILDFGNGVESRIEFTQETAPREIESIFDNDLPWIDASNFDEDLRYKASVRSMTDRVSDENNPIYTRVVSPKGYRPDYIFPVLWAPCSSEDISDENTVDQFINGKIETPFFKDTPRKKNDIECIPAKLAETLTQKSPKGRSPNIIVISTHGKDGKSLFISCFRTIKEYENGTLRSRGKAVFRIIKSKNKDNLSEKYKNLYRYYESVDAANLRLYLKNAGVDLTNAIVFLNACESSKSTELANVFIDLNAACVYGYHSMLSANNAHNVTLIVLFNLLSGYPGKVRLKTGEADFYPFSQKINVEIVGDEDGKKFQFTPPSSIISGGVRSERTANPGCCINFYERGDSEVYYGIVFSSETDEPAIGDGKSGLAWDILDHDISSPEDFYYDVTRLWGVEAGKTYTYRAFVGTRVDDMVLGYYSDEVGTFIGEKKEEPDKTGVKINDVIWATCNVATPGTFVDSPEIHGGYYERDEAKTVCPTGWRTPTPKEFRESLQRAEFKWVDVNGVNGGQFSDGSNKIFLPAAGYMSAEYNTLKNVNSFGHYWSSSSAYIDYGVRLAFSSSSFDLTESSKDLGFTVRCAKEPSIP